jgi:membrane protease YdiL (CAAX protease family)
MNVTQETPAQTFADRGALTALLDLLFLLGVFWAAWSLRFLGVAQIGTVSMIATCAVGLIILRRRGIEWKEVGLKRPSRKDIPLAFQAAGVVVAAYLSTPVLTFLLGPLTPSTAIEQQPLSLLGFVVDIVLFAWLGAALGEELAFRGVILHRLRALFGSGKGSDVTAAGVQAVWFGLGHSSQGAAGMALTGLMGFGLALFFLWRAKESLTPLVLAHGAINTIALTINYLAPATP